MEENATIEPRAGEAAGVSQYLTFTLGSEEYGIEILKVHEIRGYSAVTPVPNTPAHVKGIMNLRGTVIPVVDLRTKFNLSAIEYTKFTVIIIVAVAEKTVGLIVDAVSDVLEIRGPDIRPAPSLGLRSDTRFISGVADVNGKLAVLLDLDKLLNDEEVAALDGLGQ